MLIPWLALLAATLALAFLGWLAHGEHQNLPQGQAAENAAFMALRAFGFDEVYDNLPRDGAPHVDLVELYELIGARWGGLFVVGSTLAFAALALFRNQFISLWAAFRAGHTLIVGDHEMADALASEGARRGLKIIHVSAEVSEPEQAGGLITLPRIAGEDPLSAGRAPWARRVIIAETDLGASIETAMQALSKLPAASSDAARVAVHLDDPIIAERVHHAPGGANLFAFSEAQAAA
ncbi:MAG TPA: hypothetical protein VHX64_13625, partial [Caulobacteraceae bacterium]|nr:hypothetical protein [Caulobacteraceae bacterium]